jgi:hypothetical protein
MSVSDHPTFVAIGSGHRHQSPCIAPGKNAAQTVAFSDSNLYSDALVHQLLSTRNPVFKQND